jgi:DedD protein
MQDDGFHEIQLNGKQLVFLFMAATVVSVVIFLCGVLVGRGVRAERGFVAEQASAATADITPSPAPPAPAAAPAGSDPTAASTPPSAEDLSAPERLGKQNAPKEPLTAESKPEPKPEPEPAPKAEKKPAVAPPAPAPTVPPHTATSGASAPAATEPPGQGYAVQIAAFNVRGEAEAIASRLTSKGYAAYVLSPASGSPSVFRVRVGKFPTKREADSVAAKLRKEEQFNPWVTR